MNQKESVIGIELGSTRIKAVLINREFKTLASGSSEWENRLENGIWTYHYDEIISGLQNSFRGLKKDYKERYNEELTETGAIGISAMMHGYIPLDKDYNTLAPFRTWRNTITAESADKLTCLFNFNIPQRWSIAHFYQAILNCEEHIKRIKHIETLSSYVSRLLTGEDNIGLDDASGMFPIDSTSLTYNKEMALQFYNLTGYDIYSIFPKVLKCGEISGYLTKEGALLLDPTGTFKCGIPLSPPEGDAGTGMVSTNSVKVNTGNVSAGTSDFMMVVTDEKLGVHKEIDMVTTPSGKPVAMVHCNNCTTDINSWINLFSEFLERLNIKKSKDEIFSLLYSISLESKKDCGGMISCNYYSGEGVTNFDKGIPLFIHSGDMDLSSFMRCHMMSALSTLKIGFDILKKEDVKIERMFAHGGYFKTPKAGQTILSAALSSPVSVMENADVGGAYGMALLSAYMLWNEGKTLEEYLEERVFLNKNVETIMASDDDILGFEKYIENYKKVLCVEKKALEVFNA